MTYVYTPVATVFQREMANKSRIFDNDDRTIDLEVADDLMEAPAKAYATHWTKERWYGYIWYEPTEEGLWHEEIVFEGAITETFHAQTPEELFNKVGEAKGWK